MKKRINVRLPNNAVREIREKMLHEGYGLNEKSLWITEAINDFLSLKDYQNLVEMAELVREFSKTETVYIDSELEDKIEQAVIDVRRKYPTLEGVKSLIIRASIIHRLVIRNRIKSSH